LTACKDGNVKAKGKENRETFKFLASAGDQKNANSPPVQSWNRIGETNNLT